MLGYTGYLHALEYARERRQGRPLKERDPQSPMIPLIQHADIRRMLLAQKSFVEGGLALCLYAATLSDQKKYAEDQQVREESAGLLDLLIPIVKSWPSQFCVEANSLAIQVHGGYGYTREYPVEQFYRDNRLNPIHEGTHGIQSLDLLARKLTQNKGAGLRQLIGLIESSIQRAGEYASLEELRKPLEQLLQHLQTTTQALLTDLGSGKLNETLANSALYMKVFGHAVIGWRWLEQAIRAEEGLARGNTSDESFYRGKLQAARYFLTWEVPACHHELNLLDARDQTCMAMQDGWF